MKADNQYDYIITGAGCAGLSLVMHLIHSGHFYNKKILLVDKDAKNKNDRTWCFWEKGEGLFEPVVFKKWEKLHFYSDGFFKELNIYPYQYKLIRGIDFYNYCLATMGQYGNIEFLQRSIDTIFSNERETGIVAEGQTFRAQYVFNSILFNKPPLKNNQYWLLQHFKGWFIKTAHPVFDASTATLMDFRTGQSGGTAFFYVLPFSANEALVEYTLFSETILPDTAYEQALKNYIETNISIKEYAVIEKEFGVIPMTNYLFPRKENNIIHIGTAGGQTKGSSGYTFRFIQKHSAAIVQSLITKGHPFDIKETGRRFHFYDSVLLHILQHRTLQGAGIFTHLFKKNPPAQVLKFLDNETNLPEELRIISTLPTLPFAKTAVRHIKGGG